MKLKASYEKQEDIPEAYRGLFTEKDGAWELTEVEGIRTSADTDRLQEALNKERKDHKDTKAKLKAFDDIDPEQVAKDKDELEELRIRVENVDDNKQEERIAKLVDQRVKREVAPLERERDKLTRENNELKASNEDLNGQITRGKVEAAVRKAAETAGVVPSAIDDIVLLGERVFEVTEDGHVVTRDNAGATPGVTPEVYLGDMKSKRPHWWPVSQGGGAGGGSGVDGFPNNPWSRDHWDKTVQGKVFAEKGQEVAERMAKSVGSTLHATHPPAPPAQGS